MADEAFRVFELSLQGFGCSQILAIMALEAQGKSDPLMIRAMSGLLNGLGVGKTCGALAGGCCVLGLYAGRGETEEAEDAQLPIMLGELVEWFEAEYGERYHGIDCDNIVDKDPSRRLATCPQLIVATFNKVTEILARHDYPLEGRERESHE
jgi:hypothetical protein